MRALLLALPLFLVSSSPAAAGLPPGPLDDEPGMWRITRHRITLQRRVSGTQAITVAYDPKSWNPYRTIDFATFNTWWENRFHARLPRGEPTPEPGDKVYFHEQLGGESRNLGYGFVRKLRREKGAVVVEAVVAKFFYMDPYGQIRSAPSEGPGSKKSSWVGTLDTGKQPEANAFYMSLLKTGRALEREVPSVAKLREIYLTQLRRGNDDEKMQAADVLKAFPKAPDIEAALLRAMNSQNWLTRQAMVLALARYADSPQVQRRVSRRFGDVEIRVRLAAALVCIIGDFSLTRARDNIMGALLGRDWPLHHLAMEGWKWLPREVALGGVPKLRKALANSRRPIQQVRAAHALAAIGQDLVRGRALVARAAFGAKTMELRRMAVSTMAAFGPTIRPDLRRLLKDEKGILRKWAGTQLGLLGEKDREVLMQVYAAHEFGDELERPSAAAMEALGFTPETLKDHLVTTLAADPENIPWLIRARKTIGTDIPRDALAAFGAAAVPALEAEFRRKTDEQIAAIFARMGPDGVAPLIRLFQAMAPEWLHSALHQALGIGAAGGPLVPLLRRYLAHPRPYVRENAAELLGDIGPAAKAAVPDLVRALSDTESSVREDAARALGEIGGAAAGALPMLERMVLSEDFMASNAAYSAFEGIVAGMYRELPAKRRLSWLATRLRSPSPATRYGTVISLRAMGTEARPAFSLLVVATRDAHEKVRFQASRALLALEMPERTMPAVTALLKDPNDWVRMNVAYNLERAGKKARLALPALKAALRDRHPQVRSNARDAIEAIQKD